MAGARVTSPKEMMPHKLNSLPGKVEGIPWHVLKSLLCAGMIPHKVRRALSKQNHAKYEILGGMK